MLIVSKPIVNKSKQGVELLVENPMFLPLKLLRQSAEEPKPQRKSRKRPYMENKAEHNASVRVEALNESSMRNEGPQDRFVIQRPRTDLGGTIGENLLDRLVRPAYIEFAKSVTETSSKVREPKTYNKTISKSIYGNRWRKAIDEELWNLDFYQT